MYDALAPAAHKLAEQQVDMANLVKQSHIATANSEFLDWFAQDKGTERDVSTYAKVTAKVLDENNNAVTNIDIGDRFASIGDEPIFYTVIAINSDSSVLLQSESVGSTANSYIGQIQPATPNDSINWAEITEISVPAKDEESDESLRSRLLSPNQYINYGGNVNDYKAMLDNIKDVGAVQIYPAWQGGGTVKLVILDNNLNPATSTLLNEVKVTVDPVTDSGLGYGLAPIGHQVTVTTPELFDVNVNVKVTTDGKIGLDILNNEIKSAIQNYFNDLRKKWDKDNNFKYEMTIYRSQIMAIVLQLEHVVNAEMPKVNNADSDIDLVFNNETSQLPNLKDVMIDD
ncbi:baseplate J/gp47 family protein (plasmid) [Apilactobacillus apisilvae]|uniref:Baseplate J/gp47 family protein n=1 Tax=Apilactobacillus apisilvae TaxID=2923364 RepID=A0ABY4PK95_9LACO|nr:baseplate J/gp47 family protein [Apilactobacillus apisilvae]UQS85824.1 baseplate J/gp47 family protein [Apilactobacillus apisilvae]